MTLPRTRGAGRPSSTTDQVVTVHADYPAHADWQQVAGQVADVVVAAFVSSRETLQYPDTSSGGDAQHNPQAGVKLTQSELHELAVPVTVSTMRVTQSLKGSLTAGGTIQVSQVGGVKDGTTVRDDQTRLLKDYAGLVSGRQFLLFLNRQGPTLFDAASPTLGVYGVGTGDAVLELGPVSSQGRSAQRLPSAGSRWPR